MFPKRKGFMMGSVPVKEIIGVVLGGLVLIGLLWMCLFGVNEYLKGSGFGSAGRFDDRFGMLGLVSNSRGSVTLGMDADMIEHDLEGKLEVTFINEIGIRKVYSGVNYFSQTSSEYILSNKDGEIGRVQKGNNDHYTFRIVPDCSGTSGKDQ